MTTQYMHKLTFENTKHIHNIMWLLTHGQSLISSHGSALSGIIFLNQW